MENKKKHHFVPTGYLNEFLRDGDKLCVYRKEDPEREIWNKPTETGFRRYYYAQPTQDGGRDTNKLEDFFSTVETQYPAFIQNLREGSIPSDSLEFLFTFLSLQMARTPATREMVELMLANEVLQTARSLERSGRLPPIPKGFENLLDHVEVSIDPHQSIHAMASLIEGFGSLLDRLGFSVVQNQTGVDFNTCDNPVIWFDPTVPVNQMRPHTIDPDGPVILFFPLAKDLAIFASDQSLQYRNAHGLFFGPNADTGVVEKMNDLVARFAYQFIFSSADEHRALAMKYRNEVPVLKSENIETPEGVLTIHCRVFGTRKAPAKWKRK